MFLLALVDFLRMGNWCCCFKKSDYCDHEDDEHQRILDHAVGINDGDHRDSRYGSTTVHNYSNSASYPNSNHPNQLNGNVNSNQQNVENQQNQLYQKVLDTLTSKVIDIAAIEKSCEQADLTDREQAYRDKLMGIQKSVQLPSNSIAPMPDAEYPHKNREPIPIEDYRFITDVTIKLNKAIEEGFKIRCDEPFVVNFDA